MKSVTRLWKQFQPKTYNVTFALDEAHSRFYGTVVISGKKVGRPSQRITLHQNNLHIQSAQVIRHDKHGSLEMPISRINRQQTLHELRLHSDTMLYPGEYTLTIQFSGDITTGMTGIYPCFFKDGSTKKQLLATQFESHHAREAFPCIDEPEAKAVFTLRLLTRPNCTVLANTPIAQQQPTTAAAVATHTGAPQAILAPMWLETVFEPTPHMSAYLLAFVVGELQSKSTKTNRGTDVSIWATPVQPSASLDFALDVAKRSIEFFEEYFDMPYPLPKADHVALPDFSSGAMENWGLITYRERVLLAYPGETAQSTFEQIATVIAHETSHQWFGNLVTMRWWDDLWLNESFANLMEYQATDSMFPDWHIWNSFVAGEGLSAFRRDALPGVQAVKTSVHHPDEISSLFDPSIVYAKGGRLLYMLKNYIGEEAFRTGLTHYFTKHAYGNTEGADLWQALSDASGKDVAAFMNPWLTRSGFPLITITSDSSNTTLYQEHFLDTPTKADPERLWPVPLFSDDTALPAVLDSRDKTLPVSTKALFNSGSKGHYLVRYASMEHRQAIIDRIAARTLGESDRLMLLNGASMQARAGYEAYRTVLELLSAYKHESHESVWDIMALVIGEARRFIDLDATLDDRIKPFAYNLAAEQIARLGWEPVANEPATDEKLRALVLGMGAYAEHPSVVTKAQGLFAAYRDNNTPITAELRSLVFIVPIKHGDRSAFDYLVHLHDGTQNSDLKGDAADALTATRNPDWATELLNRLKNPSLIKPQDVDRWLVYLLRNRFTRDVAWDWMVANWSWLEKTFANDKSYDYLPRYAATCVNTREYEQKYHDLFESKQDQLILKRNIQLGFEEITARIAWLERDLQGVQEFFTSTDL